jgi:molybdate transport system substrate-binding protein
MSRIASSAARLILALAATIAQGAEIHVMTSGGFTAALNELAPRYERETGDKLAIVYGASMGATPTAIPARLARGEPADVVILARAALDGLVADGKVARGVETELARSSALLRRKERAQTHAARRQVGGLVRQRQRCLHSERNA